MGERVLRDVSEVVHRNPEGLSRGEDEKLAEFQAKLESAHEPLEYTSGHGDGVGEDGVGTERACVRCARCTLAPLLALTLHLIELFQEIPILIGFAPISGMKCVIDARKLVKKIRFLHGLKNSKRRWSI